MSSKDSLRQFLFVYCVLTMVCIGMISYAIQHKMLGYDTFFETSQTIFGFTLDETGWIVLVSMVATFICCTIAYLVSIVLVFIITKLVQLVKKLLAKQK